MPRTDVIAIDGPAGAGKSTVARRVAEALRYTLVDTGAIYRAVALEALESGVAYDDDARLETLVTELDLSFQLEDGVNRVTLAGRDVTTAIRTPEVSMGASTVSARPVVRAGLLELQRRLATESDAPGAVLEGRDIGTVVFPDAPHKFFLTAAPEERARRRFEELRARGEDVDFEAVLDDQLRRDAQDSGREVAPLVPADDAVTVDTTGKDVDTVVAEIVAQVRARRT